MAKGYSVEIISKLRSGMVIPIWKKSNKTYMWLFNTGRGLSICIRFPNNIGIIYDLGCKDDFSPVEFISEEIMPHLEKYDSSRNPAQLIASHPHQDHIQEAEKVNSSDNFNIGLVTLPHNIDVEGQKEEKIDFDRLENSDNKKLIEESLQIFNSRAIYLKECTMFAVTIL